MDIQNYILQNIIQTLSQDIEFNDLIRMRDEDSIDPSDYKIRYIAEDEFFRHVEDITYSSNRANDYLYPFIGIDFSEIEMPIISGCLSSLNVQFSIMLKECDAESASTNSQSCSISIGDPRRHSALIAQYLIKMFDYKKTNATTGLISKTNLFAELRCTDQEFYDCDTGGTTQGDWKYNVWAKVHRNPIISSLRSREDGVYTQNVTIPVKVKAIASEQFCIDGCFDCTMC